jgi:hypothetical protein
MEAEDTLVDIYVNATIHGRTTDALRTTDELLMVQ